MKQAQILWRLGNYPAMLRRLSRELRKLDERTGKGAAADRARFCSRYGAVRMRQNRTREAIEWFLRAEREARRGGVPDVLGFSYTVHDLALLAEGRPEDATHGPAALAIFEELGDLLWQGATLNNTGLVAYELGKWSESLELYERARMIWQSTGDRWSASFAAYNRGEILSDQGHYDEADAELRAALRVWRAAGSVPEIGQGTRQLGRLAARRGDAETAHRFLAAARDRQVANGELSEALWTELWLAEAGVLAGEAGGALRRISELRSRSQKLDPAGRILPLLHRVSGWALLTLGVLDEAAAAFELGLSEVRSRSAGFEAAALLEGRVLVSRLRGEEGTAARETELDEKLAGLGIVIRPAARLPL